MASTIRSNPTELTATPAVDLELNLQIQIASGSCNFFTRRDRISHPPLATSMPKPTFRQQQQQQTTVGSVQIVNKIEYQVLPFSLPALKVDIHYSSKHSSTSNATLNKRGSFYCRGLIQSPASPLIIHPIILDFLEQIFEHIHLLRDQPRPAETPAAKAPDLDESNTDEDHLTTM